MSKSIPFVVLILAALILSACGSATTATPQATLPPVTDEIGVSAEGRLVPLQSVELSSAPAAAWPKCWSHKATPSRRTT